MEVTNVVECQELGPGEQLFAEGDDSEVRKKIYQHKEAHGLRT